MHAPIEERWYAPLVRPVRPAVDRALAELPPPGDPWSLPRTGLGGALVLQLARGFGLRRGGRAARVAVAALEGLGRSGDPSEALREVYPRYGVDAEEALASERIPAARRRTVRRYFESIRPDQDREEVPR